MDRIGDLKEVCGWFRDDISKMVYANKAAYDISGDYGFIRNILDCCYPQIRKLSGEKNTIIYGAGAVGSLVEHLVSKGARLPIKCFWDQNHADYPDGFCGKPVLSPGKELDDQTDQIVIASYNPDSVCGMRQELFSLPISDECVIEAKDFFAPFKNQYFAADIISFQDNEVFLDCGSYGFETSKNLLSKCATVKTIYAFEPIASDELKENIRACPHSDARLVEAAVWNEKGEIDFIQEDKMGSYIDGARGFRCSPTREKTRVKTVKLDDIVDPDVEVTLIKMDVEGAELMALRGAERIIINQKPKMAISIYHKPEDLTEIPRFIKTLVPEYRLYVRHYSPVAWETILYAV